MNRRRLIIVLDAEICIYDISTIKLLHTIATGPNPAGLCALSPSERCLVAYAAAGDPATEPGDVYIYNALTLEIVTVIHAHHSPITCVAINSDARLLATASNKGTIIRVFSLPHGRLVQQFRRGTYTAHIQSISFSSDSAFLSVVSDSGTVHIFRVNAQDHTSPGDPLDAVECRRHTPLAQVAGALGNYLPAPLAEMWEPARAFAYFKLPTHAHAVTAVSTTLSVALAATSDGHFLTYAIDLEKGGECALAQSMSSS